MRANEFITEAVLEAKNIYDPVKELPGVPYATLLNLIKMLLDQLKTRDPRAAKALANKSQEEVINYITGEVKDHGPKFAFVTPQVIAKAEKEYLPFDKAGIRSWAEYLKRLPQTPEEKQAMKDGYKFVNSFTPERAEKIFDWLNEKVGKDQFQQNRLFTPNLFMALVDHLGAAPKYTFDDFKNSQNFFHEVPQLHKLKINSWLELLRHKLPNVAGAAKPTTVKEPELSPREKAERLFKK